MHNKTYWIVVDNDNLVWLSRIGASYESEIPCIFQTEKHLVDFFEMNDNGWYKAKVNKNKKTIDGMWNYKEIPTKDIINYL